MWQGSRTLLMQWVKILSVMASSMAHVVVSTTVLLCTIPTPPHIHLKGRNSSLQYKGGHGGQHKKANVPGPAKEIRETSTTKPLGDSR